MASVGAAAAACAISALYSTMLVGAATLYAAKRACSAARSAGLFDALKAADCALLAAFEIALAAFAEIRAKASALASSAARPFAASSLVGASAATCSTRARYSAVVVGISCPNSAKVAFSSAIARASISACV